MNIYRGSGILKFSGGSGELNFQKKWKTKFSGGSGKLKMTKNYVFEHLNPISTCFKVSDRVEIAVK